MDVQLFDRKLEVLLVRLRGTFDLAALQRLDDGVTRFVARFGLVDAVLDFSEVDDISLPSGVIADRALKAPTLPGRTRVMVIPQADLFGVGRMFAGYQRAGGARAVIVVRTMDEAYAALGISDPDFQAV